MLPVAEIPYALLGFAVFWLVTLVVARLAIMYARRRLVQIIRSVIDKLWEGKDPSKGEKPDGWRHRAAFYAHVALSLSMLKSPMAWRWKTYKRDIHSENQT